MPKATSKAAITTEKGLVIERRFTSPGVHPYDELEWEKRDAIIGDPERPAFQQHDVEFPTSWSQNATNIVAQKYFRGQLGSAERETSVKQMVSRVAGRIAEAGREGDYFATAADADGGDEDAQWSALDQAWYRSGRRYRDLGRVFGKPNPIFIRWLNHPSFDRYWQKLVPYREQFAKLNIPVLTTTGYYAGNQSGDLYFFTQHLRYNPHADHTLVIGPYGDGAMEQGPSAALQGYQVDSAALVGLRELRYRRVPVYRFPKPTIQAVAPHAEPGAQ